MISFKSGMHTLTDALAAELGDSVKCGAKVISIDSNCDGWEVSWGTETEDVCENYDALVVAVPAPEISGLPFGGMLAAALAPLAKIQYAPVATYTMGFKRQDVSHPLDGFGVLTPKKENFSILGSLSPRFSTTARPTDISPLLIMSAECAIQSLPHWNAEKCESWFWKT